MTGWHFAREWGIAVLMSSDNVRITHHVTRNITWRWISRDETILIRTQSKITTSRQHMLQRWHIHSRCDWSKQGIERKQAVNDQKCAIVVWRTYCVLTYKEAKEAWFTGEMGRHNHAVLKIVQHIYRDVETTFPVFLHRKMRNHVESGWQAWANEGVTQATNGIV